MSEIYDAVAKIRDKYFYIRARYSSNEYNPTKSSNTIVLYGCHKEDIDVMVHDHLWHNSTYPQQDEWISQDFLHYIKYRYHIPRDYEYMGKFMLHSLDQEDLYTAISLASTYSKFDRQRKLEREKIEKEQEQERIRREKVNFIHSLKYTDIVAGILGPFYIKSYEGVVHALKMQVVLAYSLPEDDLKLAIKDKLRSIKDDVLGVAREDLKMRKIYVYGKRLKIEKITYDSTNRELNFFLSLNDTLK